GLGRTVRRLVRLKSPAPPLLSGPLEDCRTEETVIKSLLVGAIAGGAVMWIYGDRIRDYIDDMTMNVRERAAAGLEGAAERLQTVADTVEDGLSGAARRASSRAARHGRLGPRLARAELHSRPGRPLRGARRAPRPRGARPPRRRDA